MKQAIATAVGDDLPHNLEAEMGALGSILLNDQAFDTVAAILKPSDFYRAANETIFRSMLALSAGGQPIDLITLNEQLNRDGKFEAIGGDEYLSQIVVSVPHDLNAEYYAKIVQQKAMGIDLARFADEVTADVRSNQFSGREMHERAESRLFALGTGRQSGEVLTGREVMVDFEDRLRQREEGTIPGLSTGFDSFDQQAGGFQPGHLIILAGRPAMGKTALALNVAEHASLGSEVGVLIVSLEMSRSELGDRLVSGVARVNGHKLMHPERLQQDDRVNISKAIERIGSGRLFIDDAPERTVGQISSIARRFKAREDIGLVVVDYLQLVEAEQTGNRDSRQVQVAAMSRRFKVMAKALGVPVLVLSQLNRNAEGREDHRPRMADLRESGAIEQDADMVLLLHRPEYYDENDQPGTAELIVAKNRNGQAGKFQLRFDGSQTRFSDYEIGRAF